MLGYYQTGGDGKLSWRSGYRPGCSPEEIRERKNAQARQRRKDRAAGKKQCRLCRVELAAYSVSAVCPDCRAMMEAKAAAQKALE